MATLILKWTALGLGWLRGGHTERFAVAVLFCDHVLTRATTEMPGSHKLVGVSELVVAGVFLWLALRSDRWWTLAAAAALLLCVLVFALELSHSGVSTYGAISARIGLWCVVSLSLIAGVWERWLAGEAAISSRRRWRSRTAPSW